MMMGLSDVDPYEVELDREMAKNKELKKQNKELRKSLVEKKARALMMEHNDFYHRGVSGILKDLVDFIPEACEQVDKEFPEVAPDV
jgi:hypothetical protein